MVYVYIGIAIVVLILVYVIVTYNRFVSLKKMVDESFSTMDVYLKKRWDLIPNLVETVKGYAKHEADTLEEVIKLRNTTYENMNDREKIQKGEEVAQRLSKIMMLAESYPELKASENFRHLSEELVNVEDDIENARKYYNGTVKNYNIAITKFPPVIVAKMFGYKEVKMFEAEIIERNNIKVDLSSTTKSEETTQE